MSDSKIVRYYSYIDYKWLYIEVNDEVYKYFDRLKKRRKENRKSRQRIFEESNILYDDYKNFECSWYFEDKSVNIAREVEEREFSKTVWRIVDKLEPEQKSMIYDRYIKDLDFIEIAEKYGRLKSGITQLFDTIYHHLRILFVYDTDFQQTDYAICQKEKYLDELKSITEELKGDIINNLFLVPNSTAMKETLDFSKKLKQEIKVADKLKNYSLNQEQENVPLILLEGVSSPKEKNMNEEELKRLEEKYKSPEELEKAMIEKLKNIDSQTLATIMTGSIKLAVDNITRLNPEQLEEDIKQVDLMLTRKGHSEGLLNMANDLGNNPNLLNTLVEMITQNDIRLNAAGDEKPEKPKK